MGLNLPNVWSAARLQGKSWWMKRVCVNVSGLLMENVLLAIMRYAAYLSFENAPAAYGPFRQAGFRYAVVTVLSSLLVRCRPRWENLMLMVATLAYTASPSGTAR